MTDVISQLLPYSWKGVAFPSTTFKITLRHDLAQHKYPYRDGAHIEGMGRDPLQFSAHIPFYEGLILGPREAAIKTPLYPVAFRDFFDVAIVGTTDYMVHPEIGRIRCKLESAEFEWNATKRGGCDVDVVWVEATDSADELEALLTQASPSQQFAEAARVATQEIDAALAKLRTRNASADKEVLALLEEYKSQEDTDTSFATFMRALNAVGDQSDLLQRRIAGKIDSVTYRAQSLQASLKRAGAGPKYWPIRQALVRMQDASSQIATDIVGDRKRGIGLYPVRVETTLASIAQDIPTKVGDIMLLNPKLVSSPIVDAGTTVRYYLDAA
jgi:hypothetical protein